MSILKPGVPVGLCSDHAGFELKSIIEGYLTAAGIEYKDYGTDSTASVDYPDFAHPLARAVEAGEVHPGIAMCGTGQGMAITLNKHQGVRAALCWDVEIARLAREHNNANVLVMPARFTSPEYAISMLEVFLNTEFAGGRHQHRIDKISVK